MCFPSSKKDYSGRQRLFGSHVSLLNNMVKSGGQGPWLCFFVLTVLVLASACARRGRDKGGKRGAGAPLPDGAVTAPAKLSPSAALPPPVSLPEVPPVPGKEAQHGGTLRIHLEGEPPHLNPLVDTLQVIDRVVDKLVYQPLIECRPDRYVPSLAESWEVSPDGLRLSLRLRPGVRWQDDKPLSAIDVQATLEFLMHSPSRSAALHEMLADLEGADIFPDHTVRLRLLRPSDLTMRALCEIPILPADALRSGSVKLSQLGRFPIGTGPFRVAAWERGKRIKLVRNRLYEASPGPLLDEVVFEIDNDAARALTRLRRNEIDILPRVSEAHYPDQVSQATLRDVLSLYIQHPDRYSFVVLNTRHGVLSDPAFRRALSLLWDRSRFVDEFHHGLAEPIGAPTFGKAVSDPFDRTLAAQVLDGAGFRDTNGDGVREVGGAAIRLVFLLPAGARTLAAEVKAFALDLRRVGILLDTTTIDGSTLVGRLARDDFEMAAMTWDGRKDEDPRLLLGSQGDFQYTGYRSDRFTATVDLLKVAIAPLGRAPLEQQLADVLAEDRPALFLYRHNVPVLVSRRVHGLAGQGDRLDLQGVWVDP
jgi:peptide/nickel transport system substrate-binding protein